MPASARIPRKGRPTEQEAKEIERRILAVARDAFAELGYRAVTTRMVAEKAQVSTRTLYNRFPDKGALFAACLDFGAEGFPRLELVKDTDPRQALERHAAAIVRMLSLDSSFRLGSLIFREGGEFPEMLKASEDNYELYLVAPLARYLLTAELVKNDAKSQARLFVIMALAEWQRRVTYRRAPLSEADIVRHARLITDIFLNGICSRRHR